MADFAVGEVVARFSGEGSGGVPLLDPVEDMGAATSGQFLLRQDQIDWMYILTGWSFGATFIYAFAADYTKFRITSSFRRAYVKAVLRQDIGWFDVNNPLELATRMGEAMQESLVPSARAWR